ncbi:MAG: hypothetical protein HY784_11115 [Chloroflexi bacterium]|nr:hypothetical protein [Chloroflexota bacterium]
MLTYGLHGGPDWKAENILPNGAGGSDFLALKGGQLLGLVRTRLAGLHNVGNCLAALAAVDLLGVGFNTARNALAEYRGAGRRFQVLTPDSNGRGADPDGSRRGAGVTIVDDYAHHPTEIRATLAAARLRFSGRPLWAVFQPHTFSRTMALLEQFAGAFADADHVLVTDIFAAREAADPGVSSAQLVQQMVHPDARYVPTLAAAVEAVLAGLKVGDVLVTLGAGDVNTVGAQVLGRLQEAGQ